MATTSNHRLDTIITFNNIDNTLESASRNEEDSAYPADLSFAGFGQDVEKAERAAFLHIVEKLYAAPTASAAPCRAARRK